MKKKFGARISETGTIGKKMHKQTKIKNKVMGRNLKKKRRMGIPIPGGDFVAPGLVKTATVKNK
jgi:hypothetical protein